MDSHLKSTGVLLVLLGVRIKDLVPLRVSTLTDQKVPQQEIFAVHLRVSS